MGRVLFPIREFYDSASELVGIKTGILLNRTNISNLLVEKFEDEFLKSDDLNSFIRLRAERIEDMIIHLRRRLGNLPLESTTAKDYRILNTYLDKSKDFRMAGLPSIGLHFIWGNPIISFNELVAKLIESEKIDIVLATAIANIAIEDHDTSILLQGSTNWDGFTPLSKIFDCELKPELEYDFIDQKFIDYLAVNGHEIELIHWRNFERFCAQYFKKSGYHVTLGPGTNDGGIDVKVYKDKNASPYILIQCKRYTDQHKVTIETVKAFYTDVLFENAQEGLIATTGHIATGGKKVCQTRKYNIKFAEKENIQQWATNMWTYSKR